MTWKCPLCGRPFRNQNQMHSCNSRTVDEAFAGNGKKWLPLYNELLAAARNILPEFYEHCPSSGVMWKDKSTFAEFKYTRNAFNIVFYADRLKPEREPVKYLKTSAKRVVHMIACTHNKNFPQILEWIEESYILTQG
jgi:hypothetical protein